VNEIFTRGFSYLKFRRFWIGETKETWNKLLDTCIQFSFIDELDRVFWLFKSGVLSVKSMYSFLIDKNVKFPYKAL
jgi:hypothetical protein